MATKRSSWKAAFRGHFTRGRNFGRDDRATTAVEFGLLGIPFFAIIGAILETALVFFANQVLDSAVQDSSRLIRTGQAKQAKFDPVSFKAEVCGHLYGLFDCSQLKLRTSVVGTFKAGTLIQSQPLDEKGKWKADWDQDKYDGGVKSSVVMVEAYYKWPVVINLGGFNMQNTPDGKRLLSAVRLFTNEPF